MTLGEAQLMHTIIEIDTSRIHAWESFHDLFAEVIGFPDFYGHNLAA